MELLKEITWPGALVLCVGLLALAATVSAFFIAASGSKFPWEK